MFDKRENTTGYISRLSNHIWKEDAPEIVCLMFYLTKNNIGINVLINN